MPDESVFRGTKLCVVGNINRDLKTTPIPTGDYLFADGETSIDGVSETIGGGGANCASIAAALGAESSFIGQIGDDETGRRLEQTLTRIGVRCHLHQATGVATGTTLNLVYRTGHRHFLSCHPNNASLAFEALDLSPLRDADHLLRADVWFSDAMLHGGNEKLFTAARDAGVPVSIDLNWDPQWGRAGHEGIERRKEAVRRILPLVDLAHGNVRELNEFSGETELQRSLARLMEWGVKAVVVHLGAQGAGYFSGTEFLVEPPAPIRQHLRATGSGDVLSTCLILTHGSSLPVSERLRLANRITAGFIEGRLNLIPSL
jgi:sugar/nucleoside kinase (ribokinase family)